MWWNCRLERPPPRHNKEVALSFLIQLQTDINQAVIPDSLGICWPLYYDLVRICKGYFNAVAFLFLALSELNRHSVGSLRCHLAESNMSKENGVCTSSRVKLSPFTIGDGCDWLEVVTQEKDNDTWEARNTAMSTVPQHTYFQPSRSKGYTFCTTQNTMLIIFECTQNTPPA